MSADLGNGGAAQYPDYDDGECPICGGEGFVFDCFDGCCADCDVGCDDCTRPCSCQKRQASPELQEVLSAALSKVRGTSHG